MDQADLIKQADESCRKTIKELLDNNEPIMSIAIVAIRANNSYDNPLNVWMGQQHMMVGLLEEQKNRVWFIIQQMVTQTQNARFQQIKEARCQNRLACIYPDCPCMEVKPN